jgi:cytoskeletal protein CcmA (bactofilin family)
MSQYETVRRRGSVYVAVLGGALLLTVIGVSTLTVLRLGGRSARASSDFADARLHARSALEMGLLRIDTDANWRTNNPDGEWIAKSAVGRGFYSLEGVDPSDGQLAGDDTQPVVLTGEGLAGTARFQLQVQLQAEVRPLEALRTCIHAAGAFDLKGGRALTVSGAPASSNNEFRLENGATVTGSVEAGTLSNGGTITGSTTVPAAPKGAPSSEVVDLYVALGTPLAVSGTARGFVLSANVNPFGATNADGVYYIDTAGSDLTIENARIVGTLVVRCPGNSVVIDKTVLMRPHREDYPVLIVDGNLELTFDSTAVSLSEADEGVNFNPAGAPYLGVSDADKVDVYPSEIRGLVHARGAITLKNTARVRGTVLGESSATSDGDNQIIYNSKLYAYPPYGYTQPPIMKIAPGSWRQIVD